MVWNSLVSRHIFIQAKLPVEKLDLKTSLEEGGREKHNNEVSREELTSGPQTEHVLTIQKAEALATNLVRDPTFLLVIAFGADQKESGLWGRDWMATRPLKGLTSILSKVFAIKLGVQFSEFLHFYCSTYYTTAFTILLTRNHIIFKCHSNLRKAPSVIASAWHSNLGFYLKKYLLEFICFRSIIPSVTYIQHV